MLFEHIRDLLLQDECSRTSSDDMRTEVNSRYIQACVVVEFAVSIDVGGLDVLIEEMQVNVHAL